MVFQCGRTVLMLAAGCPQGLANVRALLVHDGIKTSLKNNVSDLSLRLIYKIGSQIYFFYCTSTQLGQTAIDLAESDEVRRLIKAYG